MTDAVMMPKEDRGKTTNMYEAEVHIRKEEERGCHPVAADWIFNNFMLTEKIKTLIMSCEMQIELTKVALMQHLRTSDCGDLKESVGFSLFLCI